MNKAPILIAGPTASGKSAFAIAVAEKVGGTIINADAMQVYRELDILTARPSRDDERRVPHRLYGHIPAAEAYSAARFVDEARAAIQEVQDEGRVPLVVGGTGLYFKALTEGLSPIPPIDEGIRSRWRARAAEEKSEALHAILADRDPEMAARLRPSDPQRITRALEVLDSTGRSLARWQELPGEPVVRLADARLFVVTRDRDELNQRCDARFDAMLVAGAVEEVRKLMQLNLSADLPAMRAVGVRPLVEHLSGLGSIADAAATGKADTRAYVKRQLTWLKRHMIAWKSIAEQQMESIVADL